jgi:CreA protein
LLRLKPRFDPTLVGPVSSSLVLDALFGEAIVRPKTPARTRSPPVLAESRRGSTFGDFPAFLVRNKAVARLRRARFFRRGPSLERGLRPYPARTPLEIGPMKSSVETISLCTIALGAALAAGSVSAQEGPDLIFRKSTDFKLLTPNDKLATYVVDDPIIENVACAYTAHEKGGVAGMFGVAEQTSEVSLACNQYGPVKLRKENGKFSQGDLVISERRSLLWKQMHIVRGCDAKRNMLIYMIYSDKLIEGSPENSTSAVPIQPWGGATPPQCKDWVK